MGGTTDGNLIQTFCRIRFKALESALIDADYGSELFGGMDVEVIYKLDPDETEKLRAFLAERYVGSIESMLMQECGQNFMKRGPMELFEEAGVKYEKFVWIS